MIGAGASGCIAAYLLKSKGFEVEVIERGGEIGGGNRTFFYGGHPFTFGPHHFLSPFQEAYDFVSKFVKLRDLNQLLYTYVESDQEFYHYPIHVDDIPRMPEHQRIREELANLPTEFQAKNFEEFWIQKVGRSLYDKFIHSYSEKMWQIPDNQELDFGFDETVKSTPLKAGDPHVWKDRHNAYPEPIDGYNTMFEKMLMGCQVTLRSDVSEFDLDKSRVKVGDSWRPYDVLVSTISPDILHKFSFGKLRYIGREFHTIVLPCEFAFPKDVHFVYYAGRRERHTRIVEYKKLSNYQASSTLIGVEIPVLDKNPLYPMPVQSQIDLAHKYIDALPSNVHSIGRMGLYRYVDLDDIVMFCLDHFKNI